MPDAPGFTQPPRPQQAPTRAAYTPEPRYRFSEIALGYFIFAVLWGFCLLVANSLVAVIVPAGALQLAARLAVDVIIVVGPIVLLVRRSQARRGTPPPAHGRWS